MHSSLRLLNDDATLVFRSYLSPSSGCAAYSNRNSLVYALPFSAYASRFANLCWPDPSYSALHVGLEAITSSFFGRAKILSKSAIPLVKCAKCMHLNCLHDNSLAYDDCHSLGHLLSAQHIESTTVTAPV